MDLPNLRDSGLEFSDRGEVEQVGVVEKDRAEVGGAPQLALHQLVQRTRLGRDKPVKIITNFPPQTILNIQTSGTYRPNTDPQTRTEYVEDQIRISLVFNLSYFQNILRFLKFVFVGFHNNFTYRHLHVVMRK